MAEFVAAGETALVAIDQAQARLTAANDAGRLRLGMARAAVLAAIGRDDEARRIADELRAHVASY